MLTERFVCKMISAPRKTAASTLSTCQFACRALGEKKKHSSWSVFLALAHLVRVQRRHVVCFLAERSRIRTSTVVFDAAEPR